MASTAPIFATIYDTEKPVYVTLDRALTVDETLRLYVIDAAGDRVEFSPGDFVWAEMNRGAQPWPTVAAGTVVTLFLDCAALYAETNQTGIYYLNVAIWDDDNSEQEMIASQVLSLQTNLYPGQ